MPKSTPRPTNSTANATEIGLKAPASINPTAVVIASPSISAIDTAAMILRRVQRHPENEQHDHAGDERIHHDAFLRAAELVVGDCDRTGQADACLIFFGEAEDR